MKTSETTPWDEFDIHLASSLKAQYTEHSDEEIEDRLSTIMSTNVSSLDERRRRPALYAPSHRIDHTGGHLPKSGTGIDPGRRSETGTDGEACAHVCAHVCAERIEHHIG